MTCLPWHDDLQTTRANTGPDMVRMMHYEIEPNQYAIRVFEDEAHPDTYSASALLRTYGDIGFISSISSPKFFLAIDNLENLMARVGITSLEGYMTKAMARACRMGCKGKANYEITHYGKCAGRELPWVKISALYDTDPFDDLMESLKG